VTVQDWIPLSAECTVRRFLDYLACWLSAMYDAGTAAKTQTVGALSVEENRKIFLDIADASLNVRHAREMAIPSADGC
jgi:hypothetical protein